MIHPAVFWRPSWPWPAVHVYFVLIISIPPATRPCGLGRGLPTRMDGGSEPAKPANATSRQPQHRSTELAPQPWLRPLPARRARSGCCWPRRASPTPTSSRSARSRGSAGCGTRPARARASPGRPAPTVPSLRIPVASRPLMCARQPVAPHHAPVSLLPCVACALPVTERRRPCCCSARCRRRHWWRATRSASGSTSTCRTRAQ